MTLTHPVDHKCISPRQRSFVVACLWIALLSVLFAPVVKADGSALTHTPYEEQLDRYLSLSDREAKRVLLQEVIVGLNTRHAPSTYVRAWTYRAFEVAEDGDVDNAVSIVTDLVRYAERNPYPDVWSEVLANKVALLAWQGETTQALLVSDQLAEHLIHAENPRVRYYGNVVITGMFRSNSQFERALTHALYAQDALSEINNERSATRRLGLNRQIALIQSDLRNYPAALEIVNRSIREAREDSSLEEDIPSLLLMKGYLHGQMDQHQASIDVHQEAIEWAERTNQPGIVLVSMNNIGSTLIHQERYAEAEEVLSQALEQALAAENEDTAHLIQFNLGYIQVMLGNASEGIAAIEEHGAYLLEHYSESEQVDLYTYIAKAYQRAGMFEQQAEALLEQRRLNEEVFQSEREKSMSEMQARYEAIEQAQQIELLEQRNALQERVIENARLQRTIFILFGIVVVFGLILVALLYRAARRANLRLKDANKQLEFHSLRDPLTQLLNRRALQEQMSKRQTDERRAQPGQHPDAMILLDIDFFKKINDQYGHAAGDQVLKVIGERLATLARSSDMVIRWGGEEFLIFLRNSDPEKLAEITERVLRTIGDEPVQHEDMEIPVTATAGFISLPFAGIPEKDLNWERALQIADMALYIGKVHGRNQAYGIMGLNAPYEQVQPLLERDLSKAIDQDKVDYIIVKGPQK
ncbi:diguanylate cyclase [Aliidiomarina halalkaliphila]|uniref:diguanylate cyclase n=1 Tax=Aliidiomarina halalkaliphila TaxID=2593535 RepID=A0A552X0A9_9GAMM|nr:GGDEF domain-containing protein [Aliidiomarina halalkaliphila]TRW48491.1 diguanylate cyclase [Aliidiomarina halalkaliphila]